MFLGIPYNKWHFILAVIAVFLSFFILWQIFGSFLILNIGIWWTALLFFIFSVQIAHHLQCWNEIRQALDPGVGEKYGNNDLTGYQAFQSDSKDDFRWFWRGIAISWVLPLIIVFI